ncbi:hypothetical protein PEC301879_41400 [Pectobacterium carotovorum subsp. carotovorum]|nr:hypothetical protein PEC301879_41400 [Pectobacterium carotovorum subsp. carotovorum]
MKLYYGLWFRVMITTATLSDSANANMLGGTAIGISCFFQSTLHFVSFMNNVVILHYRERFFSLVCMS